MQYIISLFITDSILIRKDKWGLSLCTLHSISYLVGLELIASIQMQYSFVSRYYCALL